MGEGPQRLDKWLWFARLVRTRGLAQELIEAGRVRVNRERALASSRLVRSGDVLTVALAGGVRVIRVTGFAERRGPPTSVADLYEDLAPRARPGAGGEP